MLATTRLRGVYTALAPAFCVWVAWSGFALRARGDSVVEPAAELGHYQTRNKINSIPGVMGNASGLAYRSATESLFVVVDSPAKVVEFQPDGKAIRTIALEGFLDPEGIVHVGDNMFAIVEEGRGTLALVTISNGASRINRKDAEILKIDNLEGNSGLEGIAYDVQSECFYIVKEKKPRKIYRVTLDGKVSHPWDADKDDLGLMDLSGIHFDSASGHLYLLSHESKVVIECALDGKAYSRLPIDLEKAEGIVVGQDGKLYICGEPNAFRLYQRTPPGGEAVAGGD